MRNEKVVYASAAPGASCRGTAAKIPLTADSGSETCDWCWRCREPKGRFTVVVECPDDALESVRAQVVSMSNGAEDGVEYKRGEPAMFVRLDDGELALLPIESWPPTLAKLARAKLRTAKQICREAAENYELGLISDEQLDRWAVRYLRKGELVDDGLDDWQLVDDYDPNDDGWVQQRLRDPLLCREAARLSDEQIQALYCGYCRGVSNRVRALVRDRARKLRRWHTLTTKISATRDEQEKARLDRALARVESPADGYDLPGPMPRHGVPGSLC